MSLVKECMYVSVILILLVFCYTGCERDTTNIDALNSVVDSLQKSKDVLKRETSKTAVLKLTYNELKNIHVADSTSIGKLKKIVDRLTRIATILSSTTKNKFTAATITLSGDTVIKDSLIYVYPSYSSAYSNQWERFKLSASRDTFHVDYKVFNDFEIKQEWKRNGIFKRRTLEASIKNLNPHTETIQFKTYSLSENRNNRFRDFLVGVAVGSALTQGAQLYFSYHK